MRVARTAAVILVLVSASSAFGDTCIPYSKPWSVVSPNEQWRLTVTPMTAEGRERRRATLERKRASAGWRRHARWTFVNRWGPGGAAVADDGTVVTIDNICGSGMGPDIVVIYRPDGTLVRSRQLSDLLVEDDIALLPHSVSFMKWLRAYRVEPQARRLILTIDDPAKAQNVELPVSLDTGELLTPKRRRIRGFPTREPVVTFQADEQLLARAIEPAAATYPPVAFKARVAGDVIAEVAVSESGAVESVQIVKPLPFGLDQATEAVLRTWRFQPGSRVSGRVTMHFEMFSREPQPVD